MVLRHPARALADGRRMGVVETHDARASRVVQRQAIAEQMRPWGCGRHPLHHELDPIRPRRNEAFAVEIEQKIKARVAVLGHRIKLSLRNNLCKLHSPAWPTLGTGGSR